MIEVMIVEGAKEVIHGWAWFFFVGVVLWSLVLPAIVRSAVLTAVSVVCLGWALMFVSTIEFVTALLIADWAGFLLHLSMGIALAVSGVLVGHSRSGLGRG
jgi:uncharacterized membrane protein HdeD (DUF308 family)